MIAAALQQSGFQFHKVRLKGQSGNQAIRQSKFQFHKVRLKEYLMMRRDYMNIVSIP